MRRWRCAAVPACWVRCVLALAPQRCFTPTFSYRAELHPHGPGSLRGAHAAGTSIRARAEALRVFSIETTPKLSANVAQHCALMPPGTPVFVAALPGAALADMAKLCARLHAEGMVPVPHMTARSLRDSQDLDSWLTTMRDCGVQRVLLLAGDNATPAGTFACSMDVLRTGQLQAHGIRHVDVVAHPEGSPHMPDPMAELMPKLAWGRQNGIEMHVVTQVCFDVGAVSRLCRELRAAGVHNCIRVGLPGLASAATLLKYAAICGVGPSLNILKTKPALVLGLTKNNDPGPLLDQLSRAWAEDPEGHGEVSLHFFSFGSLNQTALWASERCSTLSSEMSADFSPHRATKQAIL